MIFFQLSNLIYAMGNCNDNSPTLLSRTPTNLPCVVVGGNPTVMRARRREKGMTVRLSPTTMKGEFVGIPDNSMDKLSLQLP